MRPIVARYKVIYQITPGNDWEIKGVPVDWGEGAINLMKQGYSKQIWREVCRQAREEELSLENYEQALGEYTRYYRISPDIHTLEGETTQELRQRLRQMYVFSREPTLTKAE